MGPAKILRNKRLELGMSDVDVARQAGLSIAAFGDIELHDEELEMAVSLGTARRLCDLLGLSLRQVLEIPAIEGTCRSDKAPGEIINTKREHAGYTRLELADRVGFDEATIESLEAEPSFGNTVPIFLLKDIEVALELPKGKRSANDTLAPSMTAC